MNTRDDERMLLMYKVIDQLSLLGVPIVFKGALVMLKALYDNQNPRNLVRKSADIDGDWVGEHVPLVAIKGALETAVKNINPGMYVVATKDYTESSAARFKVYYPDGSVAFKIDLSVRRNEFCRTYLSFVNGIKFTGVSETKIMADKISAISQRYVMRRQKDIIDIYILSGIAGFANLDILNVMKKSGRKLGDFEDFLNRYPELSKTYENFEGLNYKPEYSLIYGTVRKFVEPFIIKETKSLKWDGCSWRYI